MKFKEFIKLAILTFILTEVILPRPHCFGHGSLICSFLPPILGLLNPLFYGWIVFWMDTSVVLMISLLTALAYFYFKKRKVPLLDNLKNQKIKSLVLFLVIWILTMVIFLIPYYFYIQSLPPTMFVD